MAKRLSGEERIVVSAPPERVWDLIADVRNMGRWSTECIGVEWLDGVSEPVVGARFRGHNRIGAYRWSRDCAITEAERGRVFAFVTSQDEVEQTDWRYELRPAEGGTEVVESFENKATDRWVRIMLATHTGRAIRRRQIARGMRATLQRLKETAEAGVRSV